MQYKGIILKERLAGFIPETSEMNLGKHSVGYSSLSSYSIKTGMGRTMHSDELSSVAVVPARCTIDSNTKDV